MMKRILLAAVALTAFTVSAVAADMPVKAATKAPVMVAPYNWSGFYVGINGGAAWGRSNWTDRGDGSTTGNFDTSGGLVGGTLGANWQTGAWVFGIEGDLDWTNIRGSTNVGCGTPCETKNSWLGTVRGRVGYAWDRILPYVTGGVGFGNIRAVGLGITDTTTKAGWTLGAGVEFAVAGPWTAKIEYLYVDLGNGSCSIVACTGTGITDVKFNTNIIRGGINYRFSL